MPHLSIKKLVSTTLIASLFMIQVPLPVSAASEQDVHTATQSGIEYLQANQNADGSIAGFGGETDWAVIAIEAKGQNASDFNSSSGNSAVEFMAANPPTLTAPATEIERKILAISAINQDTTSFRGIDYNARFATHHANDQIGDTALLNDDIFGVIAVEATKDPDLFAMAQDGLNYFLAHQQSDGGFSYTTNTCDFYCGSDSNDTAAAIIAIYAAEDMSLTHASLSTSKDMAITYLLSTQQADGGFGYDIFSPSDGSSTAWGLMALNVIGSSVHNQAMQARDWLLANQNSDGGFSFAAYGYTDSDASTTAHAILALLGTTWLLNPEPLQSPPPNTPDTTSEPKVIEQSTGIQPLALGQNLNYPTDQTPDVVLASTATKAVQGTSEINETRPSNTNQSSRTDVSKSNMALYGVPVLLLIAVGWYVIQSSKKQEA